MRILTLCVSNSPGIVPLIRLSGVVAALLGRLEGNGAKYQRPVAMSPTG